MDHFLEETEEMEYMNDSFERDDEEEVNSLMREIFGDADGHEEMEDQERGNEEENGDDENNLWNDTSVNNEEMDLLKERRFIVGERSLRDLVKRISYFTCHHSEVFAPPVDAKWLPKDSLAYKEFRKIVTNREWCGSLKYYTNCRQTWAIENFFSHTLLHYCPKQNSFTYDSYHIRNMLAILDHNNHVGRAVRVREDGEPYAQAQVSRRTKQWVAYEKKCPKEYKYIPDLMVACMRETYGKPLSSYMKSEKELSLRSSQPNLSGTQNPGSKFLLACMESRKKQV